MLRELIVNVATLKVKRSRTEGEKGGHIYNMSKIYRYGHRTQDGLQSIVYFQF